MITDVTFTLVSDSQVAKDPGQALPETELGIDLTFKLKHSGQWTVAQLIRSLLPNGYVATSTCFHESCQLPVTRLRTNTEKCVESRYSKDVSWQQASPEEALLFAHVEGQHNDTKSSPEATKCTLKNNLLAVGNVHVKT